MHSKCKFTQITLKNTQSIFCCFSGIFWNYIYLYLQIFIVRNGRCTYQRTPPFRHKNYPEWMMLILPGQRTNQITPSKEVPAQNVLMNRSEKHTSELQSRQYLVCRLLLEKKKQNKTHNITLILTNHKSQHCKQHEN